MKIETKIGNTEVLYFESHFEAWLLAQHKAGVIFPGDLEAIVEFCEETYPECLSSLSKNQTTIKYIKSIEAIWKNAVEVLNERKGNQPDLPYSITPQNPS